MLCSLSLKSYAFIPSLTPPVFTSLPFPHISVLFATFFPCFLSRILISGIWATQHLTFARLVLFLLFTDFPTNLVVASSSQLLHSAFSACSLCQESGADRGGCMRNILANSWSILSLPASRHLILLPIARMMVHLCSHCRGRECHSFFL